MFVDCGQQIEYTAHSECWTSTSKGSRIYIEALRHASYGLMARIINHWLRGSQRLTEISLSTTVRVLDFQSTTDINNPPTWPKPPARDDRPNSLEGWLERPHYYPSALKNPLFIVLKDWIKKEGVDRRLEMSGATDQQETADLDSSSESDDTLTDLDSDDFDDMGERLGQDAGTTLESIGGARSGQEISPNA